MVVVTESMGMAVVVVVAVAVGVWMIVFVIMVVGLRMFVGMCHGYVFICSRRAREQSCR
jgi:hypothetical protein